MSEAGRSEPLRLEDSDDNLGRGWKRLSSAELIGLVYIALKLTPPREN